MTIPVLTSYDCVMTLMTWHGKNIKFWENLSPCNKISIMKELIFLLFFLVFKVNSSKAEISGRERLKSQYPYRIHFYINFDLLDDMKLLCSL